MVNWILRAWRPVENEVRHVIVQMSEICEVCQIPKTLRVLVDFVARATHKTKVMGSVR